MGDTKKPEQFSNEGKKAYQRNDYPEAARLYMLAAEAYDLAGDKINAAEMRNNSSVSSLKAGDASAALAAVDGTAAVFAEKGDIRRQGIATGNYAAALEELGRHDEAMVAYEEAADLFYSIGENDLRVHSMQALSAVQLQTGRRLQALASMKAGLDDIQHPNPKQRLLQKLLDIPFHILGR
jgi:tetratricopeptide (TPR) repeat protein